LALNSCKDDDPTPQNPTTNSIASSVILVNEGGFQKGNASLSQYEKTSGEITHDLFQNKNSQPIGDVLQSMTLINGEFWLVVNNSGKIWVVDSSSFEILHEISGFSSPRHVVKVSDEHVFVSDLFGGAVSVVNTNSYTIESTIPLSGWTEQMILAGAKGWITNRNTPYVYLADPYTHVLEDSIKLRMHGGTIFKDKETVDLFVLCEAQWDLSTQACIYRIDPKARQIVDSLEFPLGTPVSHLTHSSSGADLLYVSNGLHKISSSNMEMSTKPINLLESKSVYGIGVDPETSNIYVSDAVDFTNRSKVYVLDQDGNELNSFDAGVNCNGFYFK